MFFLQRIGLTDYKAKFYLVKGTVTVMKEFDHKLTEGTDIGLAVFKLTETKGSELGNNFHPQPLKAYEDVEMKGYNILIAGYPTEVDGDDDD